MRTCAALCPPPETKRPEPTKGLMMLEPDIFAGLARSDSCAPAFDLQRLLRNSSKARLGTCFSTRLQEAKDCSHNHRKHSGLGKEKICPRRRGGWG